MRNAGWNSPESALHAFKDEGLEEPGGVRCHLIGLAGIDCARSLRRTAVRSAPACAGALPCAQSVKIHPQSQMAQAWMT
jgi:hypothetical protein